MAFWKLIGMRTSLLILSLVILPAAVFAQAEKEDAPTAPAAEAETERAFAGAGRVLHWPKLSGEAGEDIRLNAHLEPEWRVGELFVAVRPIGGNLQYFRFQRVRGNEYTAVIPGALVQPPGLEYAIAATDPEGEYRAHFASIEAPQHINVYGYSAEMREADRLEGWRGNRSTVRVSGELARYGRRVEQLTPGIAGPSDRHSDQYWRTELAYTYRPLRTIYDFSFGFGVLRGQRPTVDGLTVPWGGAADGQPGLNYGFSGINFQLLRYLTLGPRLILGASDSGFVAGMGGRVYLGDPGSTHFLVDAEYIGDIGARTDILFRWATLDRFPMALGLQLTNWPYEARTLDNGSEVEGRPEAATMFFDLGVRVVDELTLTGRIGRANRAGSIEPGYLLGLSAEYGF
jgi:hypothetical protein